jgi:DNA-binding LacI/PurR family transcriptional regulator
MTTDNSKLAKMPRVGQRKIAELSGVSISTVSRALNNLPGVKEEVQQRVLAAATELGYQKDEPKRTGRIQTVSLLTSLSLGPSMDPFHADVLHGVELACGREGIHLSYATSGNNATTNDVIERLKQNPVDGLLLLSLDDTRLIEQIRSLKLPIVMINIDHRELPIDTFLPDNWQGALLAMRHLIACGHRRILHMTLSDRRTIQRRFEAYKTALAEADIPYDPQLVIDTHLNAEDAYKKMKDRLAATKPDFTAVFCANDWAAMGVSRALQESGLRVPHDISVIGFDDIATAAFLSPPLTTVRIESVELARLALCRLLDRAAEPNLTPIRVLLSCRLIERQSVAKVNFLS